MIRNVGDIPVYYEEYGKGKAILCIHGRGVDHRLMTGCLEPVFTQIQGYRRIYLDLPGMGNTPSAEWIHNPHDMLEVISGFINEIIPDENFLIAGESAGGRLALGLIHDMKERIDGVLMICPAVPYNGDNPVRSIIHKSEELDPNGNDSDLKTFLDIAVIATPEIYDKFKNKVLPGIKAADQEFLSNQYTGGYDPDFENESKNIIFDKPTCILAGKQDHWVGYAGAYELLNRFPRATFAVLDCAGHNLQFENVPLFNQHLKDWIWRLELTCTSRL